MTSEPIVLSGCSPTPLVSYLKALGILRLLSSAANSVQENAADPNARGWWQNETFLLATRLDRDDLIRFFLEQYAPSPIISAWNGRAGFLEGDEGSVSKRTGAILMREIEQSQASRLMLMRKTIDFLRQNHSLARLDNLSARAKKLGKMMKDSSGDRKHDLQDEKRNVEKYRKELKNELLLSLRSTTRAAHVSYIDACFVLATDQMAAPILGSGGNDGSRDFGVNFAEHIKDLFDFGNGNPADRSCEELEAAFWGKAGRLESRGTMGQFGPGQGGPNATVGFFGKNPLNSWDVVLAMEGTLVFGGAITRQWGATGQSRAAFPFTFRPSQAGSGALSSEDSNPPRAEIWSPLWSKPASVSELQVVFGEGRLTLGSRTARTGLDAARAVARLGISRGISGFERYSMIQPDGRTPYQATPLGRISTPDRPQQDLSRDLDVGNWWQRVQRLVGNQNKVPARARQTVRRLADALFVITDTRRAAGGARSALVALGDFVSWLVTSPEIMGKLDPPPRLSSGWIRGADDGSPEFRIAAVLAGIGLPSRNGVSHGRQPAAGLPMAAHFAPIDEDRFLCSQQCVRFWASTESSPNVVWGGRELVANLIAVLERRLVEASIRDLNTRLLSGATFPSLSDIVALLAGDFDDARCAALLGGMVWAEPTRLQRSNPDSTIGVGDTVVPLAYAGLKPAFVPDEALQRIGALPAPAKIPVPPGLVARLRTAGGDTSGKATNQAFETALARARAAGLVSPFDRSANRLGTDRHSGRIGAGIRADRLAASLLVPVGDLTLASLIRRLWPGVLSEDFTST